MINKLLTISLIIVLLFLFRECNKNELLSSNLKSVNFELQKSINDYGKSQSKVKTLSLKRKELKKAFDSLKITRQTIGATKIESKTIVKTKTNTIVTYDTIEVTGDTIYPIYTGVLSDYWYKANITAKRDSTTLDFTYYDNILLKREQKRGLIRDQPITLTITPQNPHSSITNIKDYKVKNRGSLLVVNASLGTGYDIINKKIVPFAIYGGIGIRIIK